MLLQATIGLDDLTDMIERLTPLEIRLGDPEGKERTLVVERPSAVTLVPDRGLRIETVARLRWAVAGVVVPITVQAARILLVPEIVRREERDVLRFSLVLERADLRHVPAFLDAKIEDEVNEALLADDARPTWAFLDMLSFRIGLPARLHSAESASLEAHWGALNVSATAVVFTVSYDSSVEKRALSDGTKGATAPKG
jgi:hypothetical protein